MKRGEDTHGLGTNDTGRLGIGRNCCETIERSQSKSEEAKTGHGREKEDRLAPETEDGSKSKARERKERGRHTEARNVSPI